MTADIGQYSEETAFMQMENIFKMAVLRPRESAQLIADNSQFVEIQKDAIPRLAKMVSQSMSGCQYELSSWRSAPMHPKQANSAALDWIFLVDSLNFSFWTPDDAKFKVTLDGQSHTGYWALCAAVNRALQEGVPITSADYLSSVTLEEVRKIFRADDASVTIPLLMERCEVMNNIGATLKKEYDGCFHNCLAQCRGSAVQLVDTVVDRFPSYKDRATFQGQTVSFYKRAQILAADIWACFEGQGQGSFHDIDQLTMFADYRVPQVLLHFGVLQYNDQLLEKLSREELLDNGSREEVQIRGCSIWAVELLCQEIRRSSQSKLNSVQLDYYLWDYRRQHALDLDSVPYHRTRCIYY